MTSPAAVLRGIANERGAIGYVSVADVSPAVKTIAKIRNGQLVAP